MKLPIARILFAPLRHRYRGMITDGEVGARTIRIDPRIQYPIRVLLHEYLHILHPSWSETRIQRETSRQWVKLTWKQKAALYQKLGKAKLEEERD